MIIRRLLRPGLAAAAVAVLLAAGPVGTAMAHVVVQVGPYTVAIGWQREPTYVGEQNAVEVFIRDADGNPVDDLTGDDLKVVVTSGSTSSDPLALEPSFDEDTGLGTPGDYLTPIIPTAPGDYTFHVTGSIHDQAIDETQTSSESTFDSAVASSAIQFPQQLPTLTEVITRLDRIDSRLGAASSPDPAVAAQVSQAQSSASQAQSSASQAQSDASQALTVGVVLGAAGVVIGLIALAVAWRARRRATA